MRITEKDAAISYAKAWNRLESTDFLALLDDDAHYASQWVLPELENKEAISDYLIGKMKTIKKAGPKVYAELGHIRSGFFGGDCVFLSQGESEKIQAVVLFEVSKNKIRRFDLCIPELLNVERTGIYPI